MASGKDAAAATISEKGSVALLFSSLEIEAAKIRGKIGKRAKRAERVIFCGFLVKCHYLYGFIINDKENKIRKKDDAKTKNKRTKKQQKNLKKTK